jgi:hypothetical protein
MPEIHYIESIGLLIKKYLLGELSDAENEPLQQWIQASDVNRDKFVELTSSERLLGKMRTWNEVGTDEELVWQRIKSYLNPTSRENAFGLK